jgi:hypothetical protein
MDSHTSFSSFQSLNLFLSGAEFLFRKDLEEIDNENAANHFVFRSIYQTLRKVLANHLRKNALFFFILFSF